VTPAGGAEARALELASRLATRPRSSVRFLKASLLGALDGAIAPVAAVAEDGVEALFQAPEMREGIAAFLERRAPDFHPAAAIPDGA
jgi:enoyl-CoA hydratase/carnithine racemase